MNNAEHMITFVESQFNVKSSEIIDQYQISFVVEQSDVHHLLSTLKQEGWIQLSYLSAIDWLEDNEIEIVYILMNWEKALHIQVRTRVNRDEPVMNSIITIYPGAKYYERECHEFFGVKFPGNPDYMKQLILEEWDDIPPLRKDFDPKAYSDAHYESRKYPEKYRELNGQTSKQAERKERKNRIFRVRKGGRK